MEKYSGIHDDQTHSRRVKILYYCTLQLICNRQYSGFSFVEYLNTRTKIFKYSNGSAFKYSDNSIRNSNIFDIVLSQSWSKLTTQSDFDKMHCWAKRTSMISGNHLSIGWWYICNIFSECILLKANVCFLGIIFCLVGFDVYTNNDFHSLNWSQ